MNDFTSFFEKVKLIHSPREESGSSELTSPSIFVITVIIHGNELNRIISSLEKDDNTCKIKTGLFINNVSIPSGSRIMTVQGYDISGKSMMFVSDLLYILRNKDMVTIQFSPSDFFTGICTPKERQEVSLSQCVLYLLSHYSTISDISDSELKKCRVNVIRNHYITIQQLNYRNPSLILDDILLPSDVEHFLIVERLFVHAVKNLFSQPILTKSLIQPFYQGTIYNPTIEQIRILLKKLSSTSKSSLFLLFRYYDCVYQQYNQLPTNEIIPILCDEVDISLCTTLVLSLSQFMKDPRELWLAGCLLEWIVKNHLFFKDHSGSYSPMTPTESLLSKEMLQYRAASLLMMLQDCNNKLEVKMVIETNASITLMDIISTVLLLVYCEKDGLLCDWFLPIAESIFDPMEDQSVKYNQFNYLSQIHSLIALLSLSQQSCLFWLIRVLILFPDVIPTVASSFSELRTNWMIEFLLFLMNHIEFVFLPFIPSLTQQSDCIEKKIWILPSSLTEIIRPSFSMHSSFASLHQFALTSKGISDIRLLEKIYSIPNTFAYPHIIHSNSVEWKAPYAKIISFHQKESFK